MSEFGGCIGYNNIPNIIATTIEELCSKCKQAELCDLTRAYKRNKYTETGTCRLFIMKEGDDKK